jgi:hypothetical protein
MITFSHLGNHGRLGNQMFQYAMLLGVSQKTGFTVAIPKEVHSLADCFKIKTKVYDINIDGQKIVNLAKRYQENNFHFEDTVFTAGDNIDYRGNYQTDKYFKHCEALIREQFTFKDEIREASSKFINSLREHKELVSVHVRRGDYLDKQDYHPIQTVGWYETCFNKFDVNNATFVIFSDDIEWCKKNFSSKYDIKFSNLSSQYEDLCAMSLCDHNIIANSSFSWWGAWLNKSLAKKVVAPSKWFGRLYAYYKLHDLYCEGWEVI